MLRLPLPKLRQGPSLPTPVTQCKRRAQVLRWGQSVTLDGEWLGRFRCQVQGDWGWSGSPSGRGAEAAHLNVIPPLQHDLKARLAQDGNNLLAGEPSKP
jgi:hypothetical protein